MKRIAALVAVLALAGAFAGSAFAFDCMRVSSSYQGLQQSTNGGHWLLFDMTTEASWFEFFGHNGITLTPAQADCLIANYPSQTMPDGQPVPLYFALGDGVAGGFTGGPGVLAWNNPNDSVLANGKGIDHLEDAILGAVFTAAGECGIGA